MNGRLFLVEQTTATTLLVKQGRSGRRGCVSFLDPEITAVAALDQGLAAFELHASGDEKLALLAQVREQFGNVVY